LNLFKKPAKATAVPKLDIFEYEAVEETLTALEQQHFSEKYLEAAFAEHKHFYDKAIWWADRTLGVKREEKFIVSPVGLIDIYRHYFYDLGTFLGPPIEHLWIAPKSKVELYEFSSKTDYRFIESETSIQIVESKEETMSEKSELSEEMQKDSEQDIKVGMSAEGGVNFAVWHASGSTSMEYANHVKNIKKTAMKKSRELSSKITSQMTKSTKLLTKKSTEIKKESSKKHVIDNNSDELINIELRKKMQKIGVQVQHLGTQFCWQIYIDTPGDDLGLAELVHISKPEDFNTTPPPDLSPPSFEMLESDYHFNVPFAPTTDSEDDNGDYIKGKHHDDNGKKIKWKFKFNAPAPQRGYMLNSVREINYERTDPDHDPPSRWATSYKVTNADNGEFEIWLNEANFEKQPAIKVTVKLIWSVSDSVKIEAENQYKSKLDQFNYQKQREAQVAFVDALRERVELARSVEARPSEDLREEERTILYRRVLNLLLDNVTSMTLHAASELVRTYFETEKMLYFVAPDWWNPRMEKYRGGITEPSIKVETIGTDENEPMSATLGQSQRVMFGREHGSRPGKNYLITEDADPAPLGSSIGWLLQLDGDNHRNAFLNCAWAKVIIPIRRGKENEAIEWLKQQYVEGTEGLDAKYIAEDGSVSNKTVGEVLNELADSIKNLDKDNALYLANQQVYENGFNPLQNAISITDKPLEIFAQWVEIVPTKQVVPIKYKLPDAD
jgi:hypothetical protein